MDELLHAIPQTRFGDVTHANDVDAMEDARVRDPVPIDSSKVEHGVATPRQGVEARPVEQVAFDHVVLAVQIAERRGRRPFLQECDGPDASAHRRAHKMRTDEPVRARDAEPGVWLHEFNRLN